MGILLEHYSGKLPLWLSPNQVNIVPVNNQIHLNHVNDIKRQLKSKDIRVKIDNSEEKMGYKIRNTQIKKIPYTIVIGDNEVSNNTLSVRKYGEQSEKAYNVAEFIEKLTDEKNII